MRKTMIFALFLLVMLAWAVAQEPRSDPAGSSGQAPSQTAPPSGSQTTPPAGSQAPPPGTPPSSGQQPTMTGEITEGCLGGTNPDFTVTDKAGTVYKLNIPQGADASSLTSHVGESVQVLGTVNKAGASGASASKGASIDVTKIGRGTSTCPGGASSEKPPAK